jgi:hypothetical protein
MQGIGFDMDYTLAQYKPETFEALAHSQTVSCREADPVSSAAHLPATTVTAVLVSMQLGLLLTTSC